MDENVLKALLTDELEDSESELSSCSDSSDSSDLEVFMTALFSCLPKEGQKGADFCDQIPFYSDKEFTKHFRISRSLYLHLAEKFSESEEYNKLHTSRTYSAGLQLALFLWFVGRENCTNRDICKHFKLPLGSTCRAMDRVMHFLSNQCTKVVRWPTEEEQTRMDLSIKEKTGIQGVVGIIGCIRIWIDPPRLRKHLYADESTDGSSLCLQGICDDRMKFTDISVGCPGSLQDNKVFERSSIYRRLEELCQHKFLLGSSGYACSQYVLTPYRAKGRLSARHKVFNENLCAARTPINEAFRLLTRRFPQLKHCKLRSTVKVCQFIRACVVLHNLSSDDIDFEEVDQGEVCKDGERLPRGEEEDSSVRDRVCDELLAHLNVQQ